MNRERAFAKTIIEELKYVVEPEFEKISVGFLPIYLMRFEGKIKSKESIDIINKSELRELTFSEFFVAARDPNVLKSFIGECIYLKGRGIGGREGYRKIMKDGKIGEFPEIGSLSNIPREMRVYVYPGNGKQSIRINDGLAGPLFVLSSVEHVTEIEAATAVAGRRKLSGFEGLSGQQGWKPRIEYHHYRRIIETAERLLDMKTINRTSVAIEEAGETVKELIRIFR